MTKSSRVPVIAVFGGNRPTTSEEDLAYALGKRIVMSGSILLTGGNGDDAHTIKEAAIRGAEEPKYAIRRLDRGTGLASQPA